MDKIWDRNPSKSEIIGHFHSSCINIHSSCIYIHPSVIRTIGWVEMLCPTMVQFLLVFCSWWSNVYFSCIVRNMEMKQHQLKIFANSYIAALITNIIYNSLHSKLTRLAVEHALSTIFKPWRVLAWTTIDTSKDNNVVAFDSRIGRKQQTGSFSVYFMTALLRLWHNRYR